MSVRLLFLLIAGVFFVFASIFLIIGIIYEKIYQNNMKGYDKEVEGKVLEVIKSGKDGVVGKLFATFVVYQYEINNHKYIVRPYSTGEDIIVKYNSNNPERHEILNDKDKTFASKVFKIVGKILMILPLIFLIISFFVKGQVQ